jgi:conjugal transfer pilus assembly protein TraK
MALQVLHAQDGQTMVAKVSRREITRIAVEDGRIRKVTGNAGDFVLERDEAQGQVFLRPADPERTRPINLFVTTDRGTVALLLQPLDLPSDTLLIRHPDPSPSSSRTHGDKPLPIEPKGSAASHLRSLKDLLLVMADGLLPPEFEFEEVAMDVPLWVDTRMRLMRRWRGATRVGETYWLTNTGQTPLEVAEQHLFRLGHLAISVEKPTLAPGESTPVHVIRLRMQGE